MNSLSPKEEIADIIDQYETEMLKTESRCQN